MPAATDRAKVIWRMKLHSAFRTAFACTIVGTTTLYGPSCIRSTVSFPAFSYLTAILIVSDANLGDTIRGCCHAFYAILQVLPLSMLSVMIIRHYYNSFSISPVRVINLNAVAAFMVALTSFLLGLPKTTPLLAKRIAFGQIVVLFVDIANHGNQYSNSNNGMIIIMLPLRVASSTALGAVSSLLALLLPYPRLAYSEVRRLCQLYAEIASERLILYFKALTAESHLIAVELIYQAKPLAETGNKLLQSISLMQEGVMWERRPWLIFLKRDCQKNPVDRLLAFETSMRGMEIALNFCHLPTSRLARQELTRILLSASLVLGLRREQPFNFNSMEVPELLKREFVEKLIFPNENETILSVDKDQPAACFFMSCAEQFINNFATAENNAVDNNLLRETKLKDPEQPGLMIRVKEICGNWIVQKLNNKERLLFAPKCSLSLGLAVLIGLIFKRENGYWSGLIIAISFVEGRQATFTAANARAQGTAIGSVYGVLGCFIFENLVKIRFLALLPWIIFTSFLRHSQMYGQPGGISAVIGALLILGRKDYGPPEEFAIARLTEAMIGLCSFILIELLLQPTRAATLAKKHLYLSLVTLQECIKQILVSTDGIGNGNDHIRFQAFGRNHHQQRNLKSHIHDLQSYTAEAELEPNFWFLPFRGPSYQKVLDSLSNMAVLLSCMTYSLEFLSQASQNYFSHWEELQQHMDNDLEICKEILSTSLGCLEKSTIFSNSFLAVHKSGDDKTIFQDKERGIDFAASRMEDNYADVDVDVVAISFLHLLKNAEEHMRGDVEVGEEVKAKIIFSFSALGFCVGCLVNEMKNAERGIKEILYWENP